MAPNNPSLPPDLSKLTVPQLRALCKERRITGYSKLGKAALLQRLATTQAPLPTELAESPQNHTVASTTSTQKTNGTKRPAHIGTCAPPKRIRTSLKPAAHAGHESPVPGPVLQQTLPVASLVLKVPEVLTQPKRSSHGDASTPARQPSGTSKRTAVPRQITQGGPGRFKSLVVSRPKRVEPNQTNREPSGAPAVSIMSKAVDSAVVSSVGSATPLPVLSYISFPPKASERRWVYRWAIILSALPPADRRTCRFVSRTLRYAVYLSATHILSRNYPGRRLDAILEQHPKNMTNLWPYLRFRTAEVSERRRVFKQSFLGQYTHSMGYDPLSEHLWTSPDDEKQVDVALRFVLTRMWFAVSVGAYGHDASKWSRCVVRDVREIIKGEIWQVVTRDDGTGESRNFYVLEATCEVIGEPPSSQGENAVGYCLRADWTTWISRRLQDGGSSSLVNCVKWSNAEDYHRGISKVWLLRVRGEDADSIAKRSIAERYILASVVANGISGPWMSTSAMAQEFAGFPSLGPRVAARSTNTVTMYLAAHHHIESIHFTTTKGDALHPAVAVVQTPGREYYILRDNGMQVGCEEEGVAAAWQRILGCDTLGRAVD